MGTIEPILDIPISLISEKTRSIKKLNSTKQKSFERLSKDQQILMENLDKEKFKKIRDLDKSLTSDQKKKLFVLLYKYDHIF